MPVLEILDLHAGYGDVSVLKGIQLQVEKGELVALVGSNGAGKSTLLRTISGLIKPHKGEITFTGKRIDHLLPHQIVEMGFIQVPGGKTAFPGNVCGGKSAGGGFQPSSPEGSGPDPPRSLSILPDS